MCPRPTAPPSTSPRVELNVPGGFGWLSLARKQHRRQQQPLAPRPEQSRGGGCRTDKPFLLTQWGNLGATPPIPPNSYGCCSEVGLPGSGDDIGSLPGNKAAVDDDTPGVGLLHRQQAWLGSCRSGTTRLGTATRTMPAITSSGTRASRSLTSADQRISGDLAPGDLPGTRWHRVPGFAGAPLATQLIR